MPCCCVVGCHNNSEKGFKLYRLPQGEANEQRRQMWIDNIGRKDPLPRHAVVCQVHFDENQFESHRADGLRKLKPYAVPTIFNTVNPKKVRSRSRKLPASELSDSIKIEAVTSLSDNAEVNKEEKMTVSTEKSNEVTSENEINVPKRKSARISIRGRRKWTNLYRREPRTTSAQTEKTQTDLMKTCPKEVRIVVERLGQPPKRSSPEESSPKRKAHGRTVLKKAPKISEETSRKRVRIEDDVQRLMSFGEGFHHPDEDEDEGSGGGGKGNCAVCNKYTDNGTVLDSQTLTSKMHFYQKLTKLAAGENGLVITEEGVLCSVCTRLLNYMDRIEVELSMLKTAILNCMRKKRVSEQKACKTDKDHHEHPGEGNKMDGVRDISKETENVDNVAEHCQQTNDEQDPDEPEPVSDSHHSSLEKADTPPDQIEITKLKPEVPSKQYKCGVCSYTTTFKSVIIFHLRQHVKGSYRCDFCNINISRKSEKVLQMSTQPHLRHKKAVPTGVTSTVSVDSAPVPSDCGAAVVSRTEEPTDINNIEDMCTKVLPSNSTVTDAPVSSTISLSETQTELLVNTDIADGENRCIEMLSDSVTEFKPSVSNTSSVNNLECVRDMPGVE
ncbi:uncharacterized protein [Anabrus simplex]